MCCISLKAVETAWIMYNQITPCIFVLGTGKPDEYQRLLANERHNYKTLYETVKELGGIPMMIKSDEMSNTIPDEKVNNR